jgi:hypothetical protein
MKHIRQTALSTSELSLIEMRQIKIFLGVFLRNTCPFQTFGLQDISLSQITVFKVVRHSERCGGSTQNHERTVSLRYRPA